MIQPVRFTPYLKTVIWGGNKIAQYKGLDTDQKNIGESWEVSAIPNHVSVVADGPYKGKTLTELINLLGAELVGEENFKKYGSTFPLLIKIIDANENLSVQVHPDDDLALKRHNAPGKTEMWNIIASKPDAKVYVGLSRQITPEEYAQRVADNTIMDAVAQYDTAPGDVFFLPAGRIHAIGAGNLLAEIQQTSDITYRIYDYERRDSDGNTRELHTDLAREAIDYTVSPTNKINPTGSLLADCEYFIVHRITEGGALPHIRDSFTVVMCLSGEAEIGYPGGSLTIRQGQTYIFPASMRQLAATPGATLLSIQS
ncbi:MAG: class I mannose-6-phosphate isomerase [Bacteroides sp.]|nr:class I mannose-6-phosphate isomerase [Bacteroides sp.]MCM1379511.1 class I mannose-6-phosphate isomerase [Bacteroides sp.]MCM1445886.1 class I mannose-6-phosphate isomerase [Prevotella sp.]